MYDTSDASGISRLAQRGILFLAAPMCAGVVATRLNMVHPVLRAYSLATSVLAVAWILSGSDSAVWAVDKNPAGQFMAATILIVLFFPAFGRTRWLVAGVNLVGLAATQSRGAVIGLAFSLIIVLLLTRRKGNALAIVGALTVAATIFLLVSPQVIVRRFLASSGESSYTAQQRTILWNDALDQYHASGGLGVGIGMYRPKDLGVANVLSPDPHNVLYFSLVEGGAALLIGFLLLAIVPLWALFVHRRILGALGVVAAAVQASTLVHSLVDIYWVRSTPDLGWLLIGAALALPLRRPATRLVRTRELDLKQGRQRSPHAEHRPVDMPESSRSEFEESAALSSLFVATPEASPTADLAAHPPIADDDMSGRSSRVFSEGTARRGLAGEVTMRGASALAGVVATALLIRGLSSADFGFFSLWGLIVTTVSTILEFSQRQAVLRDLSLHNDSSVVEMYLSQRLRLTLVLSALLAAVAVLTSPDGDQLAGVILCLTLPWASFSCSSVVLHARYRGDLIGVGVLVQSTQWLLLLLCVRLISGGLLLVCVALWISTALNGIFLVMLARRTMPFRLRYTRQKPERDARIENAWMTAAGTLSMAAWKIDLPLVYAILGATSAGVYAASYRVLDQLLIVPTAVGAVLTPNLVRAASGSGDRTRIVGYTLLGTCVLVLTFIPFSQLVANILFGHSVRNVATLMTILAAALPVVTLRYMIGSVLTVAYDAERFARVSAIYLIGACVATFVLARTHGLEGAAIGTSVSEAVFLVAALSARSARRFIAEHAFVTVASALTTAFTITLALV